MDQRNRLLRMARLAGEPIMQKVAEEQAGSSCAEVLTQVLAALLALRQQHHSAHWLVSGPTFYGDHLLFERLYGMPGDEIDTLGEKMTAQCHSPEALDPLALTIAQAHFLKSWKQDDAFKAALVGERTLQALIKVAYDKMDEDGTLSLGMDDFLMATANAHETAIYLLQQRVG